MRDLALPPIPPDPAARFEPFPLTDTQRAYWIGRGGGVALGAVGAHGYFEWDWVGVDLERLQMAWRRLIDRHDMLRAVLLPDGRQRVLESVPAYRIEASDLRGQDARMVSERLERMRTEMSHHVFDCMRWPLYELRATLLDGARTRLHMGFDLLIADPRSYLSILMPELRALYERPDLELPPPRLAFRDYVLAEPALAATDAYRRAECYWLERLASLPPAPRLPRRRDAPAGGAPHFERWRDRLDTPDWQRLRERAGRSGISPEGLLLAVFAEVLRAWTGQERFTLNMPRFQRPPLHPDVDRVVGDFTTVTLVEVGDWRGSFAARARRLQAQLEQDLAHSLFSGTRVLRELYKLGGARPGEGMPVVLTPLLDLGGAAFTALGEPVYGISQTPQVTLDYQIYEQDGALAVTWDALAGVFPDGMVDDLFAAHTALLRRLAVGEPAWRATALDATPQRRSRPRAAVTAPAPLPEQPLHRLVAAHAAAQPERRALLAGTLELGYGELQAAAARLGARLRELGAGPEQPVAVVIDRGWEQVLSVLAALHAGAPYVPIDPALPPSRVRWLLEHSRARVALTTPSVAPRLAWPGGIEVVPVGEAPPVGTPPPGDAGNQQGSALGELACILYTSGPGAPLGVMVQQRALLHAALDVCRRLGVGADDRWLSASPTSSALWACDLFAALAVGASLVLPAGGAATPRQWLELLERSGASVWHGAPGAFESLLRHVERHGLELPASLRLVLLHGERIAPDLPGRLRRAAPEARLAAIAGEPETSIWASLDPLDDPVLEGSVAVRGEPLAGCDPRVLDHELAPCPDWVPGQVHTGGPAIARGYWRDDERTAERFLIHPRTGERLFRSGEIGCRRPDGRIEPRLRAFLEIGGERVDPLEVEVALAQHAAVAAAALAVEADGDGARLLAYVQPRRAVVTAALRAHLEDLLPPHMMPAEISLVDRLPRTPSGAVDKAGLLRSRAAVSASGDKPRTPTEEALAAIWRRLLERPRVGRDQSFFQLGGDSLLATRLLAAVRLELGVQLELGTVFAASTIARMAEAVLAARAAGRADRRAEPIRPVPRDGDLPLSFAQERLWFLEQLDGDQPSYNWCSTMPLRGPLDVEAMRRGLELVVYRHEVLRTTFTVRDGRPVQVIAPPGGRVELPLVELDALAPEQRAAALAALTEDAARQRFDLRRGPLYQFTLVRLGAAEWTLIQRLHHLVFDGWSLEVLRREMTAAYDAFVQGREPALPRLDVQYADYAAWQREMLRGAALDRLLEFWTERLAGRPPLLDLRSGRARPALMSHRGRLRYASLDGGVMTELLELAKDADTTLYTVLISAFAVLLRRYARSDDVLIGTPLGNREVEGTADLLGFFVNTMVLRLDLGNNPTFVELLGQARREVASVHAHRDLPFQLLVERLNPERSPAYNPIFQVMFTYEDAALRPIELLGLEVGAPTPVSVSSRFDLTLAATRTVGGLELRWEYASDLLDDALVEGMSRELVALFGAVAANPRRPLSALTGAATTPAVAPVAAVTPVAEDPAPGAAVADRDVAPVAEVLAERFEAQVASRPDAVAVRCPDGTLTYLELHRAASRLAGALVARGIGPEALVGVCLERSLDLVVALVAVALSGGAYLPLDPEHPPERLRAIVDDARPALILGGERLQQRLGALSGDAQVVDLATLRTAAVAPLPRCRHAESLAYVIYTSGSTGVPKGVTVSQRNVVRLFDVTGGPMGLGPDDVWTMSHSVAFDFSVWELWGALLHGGRLVVAGADTIRSPHAMHDLVTREGVTILSQTPTAFTAFMLADEERGGGCERLRLVVLGGEALTLDGLAGWFRRHGDEQPRIVNMYGITETTVHVTLRWVRAADLGGAATAPIGQPLADLAVRLLDDHLSPLPAGVAGELFVAGEGVSRGYLGRPALTAERFPPDPWSRVPGGRLYRSGDLARAVGAGDLDYLGRSDGQLKIRGFRVEPREVELAVAAHPDVHAAVVVGRDQGGDRIALVAYVVPRPNADLRVDELRAFLERAVPGFMVPSAIVSLQRLPLNANGKVDTTALPDPDSARPALRAPYEPPSTPTEKLLVEEWAKVLRLDRVGVDDNFFALGGDSMRTVELVFGLRRHGLRITVADVYRQLAPRALAKAIEAGLTEPPLEAPAVEPFSLLSAADRARILGSPQTESNHEGEVVT